MKPAGMGETVLLAFVISILPGFPLLFFAERIGRKKWTMLIMFMLLVSFIFAYVSLSNVWTPATTNFTVRAGERSGLFPWSKLSYPIYMSVEHYFNRYTGRDYTGTVHFNTFLVWARIIRVNGQFRYPAFYGEFRLSYSLDSPFFTASTFYTIIIALFTVLNFISGLLGFAVAHTLSIKVSRFRRDNESHRDSS